MPDSFQHIISSAITVGLSPIPLIALILVFLSDKAKKNSLYFLLGWFVGVIVNSTIFSYLANPNISADSSSPLSTFIYILLGIGFLFLAYKQRKHMVKRQSKHPPWMSMISTLTPLMSFLIAFALITLNSKATLLDLNIGETLNQTGTVSPLSVGLVFVYAIIASSVMGLLILGFNIFGKKITPLLHTIKKFLLSNSSLILFVIFFFFGINFLFQAIYAQ